jgi:hypothetical protein
MSESKHVECRRYLTLLNEVDIKISAFLCVAGKTHMVFTKTRRLWHTADIKMQLDKVNVSKSRFYIGFDVVGIRKLIYISLKGSIFECNRAWKLIKK